MEHVHLHITGIVQGVGMRPFVYREAAAHGIAGWVLNAGDGVHIEAHAETDALKAFVQSLRAHAPAAAHIERIEVLPLCGCDNGKDVHDAVVARGAAGGISADVHDASTTSSNPRPEIRSTESGATPAFRIIDSDDTAEHTTLVSPDIATCPDCLRELFDPADRRFHYPFINCTNCGPRFTIIRSLPYDRATTSMDAFPMCPDCAREYADPLDRRFHAQPNACFECGPHITWREKKPPEAKTKYADYAKTRIERPSFFARWADFVEATCVVGDTRTTSDAIIERCSELLANGATVAIKGLGGFHLACNAEDEEAVRELRRRKRRSNKPLAVMVRSLEDAKALCRVDNTECELLAGTVRPVVLLGRRIEPDSDRTGDTTFRPNIAPSVAFNLPELGIMLPYTPLQHLLMAACTKCGVKALVMTSGNISEEPIEVDDETAWKHLVENGLADALLGNDRAILSRYDDSVVRVSDGQTQMVRRARGYAPRPLALPQLSIQPAPSAIAKHVRPAEDLCILACGPEQKATLAFTRELADGTAACFVSQHIGDVENGATFDAWHTARARFEQLFDLRPNALVCDLHPSYLSSQWAREQARTLGLPLVEIQHHHAHIAAVIAEAAARREHDPASPVIGIALDGTGAGAMRTAAGGLKPDGTIWGGEILVADLASFTRVAHLRPWRLPGGTASVRDPRRNAFSLLHAYSLLDHPGAKPLLTTLTTEERSVTATMIERGLNSPLTSSMGRFLDAISALLGVCTSATYEGEPAILLGAAAYRASKPKSAVPAQKAVVFDECERFAAFNSMHQDETHGSNPSKRQISPELPNSKLVESTDSLPSASSDSFISVKNHHIQTSSCKKDGMVATTNAQNDDIDLGPLLVSLLNGIAAGESQETLALFAHEAIIRTVTGVTVALAAQTGIHAVALSGGVFMNRLFLNGIRRGLEQQGLTVLIPHNIPVNDGCIAYGQAAIARVQLSPLLREQS